MLAIENQNLCLEFIITDWPGKIAPTVAVLPTLGGPHHRPPCNKAPDRVVTTLPDVWRTCHLAPAASITVAKS
jgi:hypothetical protein